MFLLSSCDYSYIIYIAKIDVFKDTMKIKCNFFVVNNFLRSNYIFRNFMFCNIYLAKSIDSPEPPFLSFV